MKQNISIKPAEDSLLTVAEVAKRLRVDATTVRRWILNGIMESVSLPHLNKRASYRIKESTLARVLEPAR
jgi:excisionase family DNA binding protein